MFEPLPARFNFPQGERRVLEFWQRHDVFAKSLQTRRGAERFVFYEGPPTANGVPHPGHCLTRAIKDLFPRYKTMRGYLVERKAGWDTHGLPVEIEVCKELGINSKEEIEAYGVAKFVQRCIESVFRYTREWEEMTDRLGFWINLDQAYVTYHQSYVESVWWGLKTLFERGLLYQGHKVVWWWAQGGTALSAGEVGEGYRTVEDPSVYIRFPLVEEGIKGLRDQGIKGKVSLLVWTTTPWTLISNHFAAVHPLFDYALVHDKTGDEYFYVAVDLVDEIAEKVEHEFEVVSTCRGEELVGRRYIPPFDCYYKRIPRAFFLEARKPRARDLRLGDRVFELKDGGFDYVGWRVVPADFVTLDTGTGIVHQAPAYGEVDFELLQQERARGATYPRFYDIPLLNAVAPDGTFTDEAPEQYRGRWVKDCDDEIMQELTERGIMLLQETVRHEYPFCPRAEDDPLIQYARRSWFVRTSRFKEEFLSNNDAINWLPEYIRAGRFGDFLRNNVDWALSRERYWGTPLPIWECDCGNRDCREGKHREAIGSYAELLAKPGVQGTEVWENAKTADPELPEHLKVHKPYIDAITYDSPFDTGEKPRASARADLGSETVAADEEPRGLKSAAPRARMRRVPEVIDCWWDAGSMPFAQWGFPHVEGSVQTLAERFPCDFISEAIDQTRGWFYGLLAISTLLFGTDHPASGSIGVPPASGSIGVPPASGSVGVPPASTRKPVTEELTKRRRILPHWEAGGSTYYLTFRVVTGELSPTERSLVMDACRYWDNQRMLVHAVVVMPDHVHLLATPLEKEPGQWWSVGELMHSINGFTAKKINELRGSGGAVWQREYFDRIIRDQSDFDEKWSYIVTNPQRRGLPDDYPWVWVEPSHASDQADSPRSDRRDADAPPMGNRQDANADRRDADAPPMGNRQDANADRRDADAPPMGNRQDTDADRRHADAPPMGNRQDADADRRDADAPPMGNRQDTDADRRDADAPQVKSEYPMPYKTCIVLGHVMGEDGLKMSKRTGNYKEPNYIFDRYGADAMRWYFFSAQTPWTSIRFQEAAIRDSQREFLVRLYNVFSFFNIYANIDGYDPGDGDETTKRPSDEGKEPRASARADLREEDGAASERPRGLKSAALRGTGWRPVSQRSEIDRWVSSELHRTIRFVRDALDRFENYPAAGRLNDFVDALSNWYVRRSRDRFWRPLVGSVGVSPANGPSVPPASGSVGVSPATGPRGLKPAALPLNTGYKPVPEDQDKWDAYNTLYEVLVTLSKLIAPFTPFFAETMYQNLVRSDEGGGRGPALPDGMPISVHLCDYPEADEALIDEDLAQDMDLVRHVVSTGRAARTAAKLKVRQPLAQVEIILAWRDNEQRLRAHTELIAEELNVKNVEFTHEADHYVRYRVKPNFKAIGPRLAKLAPKVGAALEALDDPAAARKTLLSEGELSLSVEGQEVTLTRADVDIRLEAKAGWSAAQGRAGVVVVSTELTPGLREEGLVRELIHRVQGLRKQQELAYETHITLHVQGPDEFLEVLGRFTEMVSRECLATRIELAAPPTGEPQRVKIEGYRITLAIVPQ